MAFAAVGGLGFALKNMVFSRGPEETKLWGSLVAIQCGVDYLSRENLIPRLVIANRNRKSVCSVGVFRVPDKPPRLIKLVRP